MKSSIPNLLITGGKGQLASALLHHPLAKNYRLILCSREEMDITEESAIQNAIARHQPDVVINTAAYTKVDQAEIDQAEALRVNYQGAKQLAVLCQQHKIPLIHISTDYVFDGKNTRPYTEDRSANAVQVYGQSKYLGEEAIRQHCGQFIILRVSGTFSEYGHNFVKTILRIAREKKPLRIVADQFTCPTYAGDIARAIFTLLTHLNKTDIFHFCSHPPVTWHQFALAIVQEARAFLPPGTLLDENEIQAITTADYPTLAKRPPYSVFDCQKIKAAYGITPAHWSLGLHQALKQLTREVSHP